MKKRNKCILLLDFSDGTKSYLIFNDRNSVNKYFKNDDNLKKLDDNGLCSYTIVFGIIQEIF